MLEKIKNFFLKKKFFKVLEKGPKENQKKWFAATAADMLREGYVCGAVRAYISVNDGKGYFSSLKERKKYSLKCGNCSRRCWERERIEEAIASKNPPSKEEVTLFAEELIRQACYSVGSYFDDLTWMLEWGISLLEGDPQKLLKIASDFLRQDNLDYAVPIIKKLPEGTKLLLEFGEEEFKNGRIYNARDAFRQLEHAVGLVACGKWYLEQGYLKDGMGCFDLAGQAPSSRELSACGELLTRTGKQEDAGEAFRLAFIYREGRENIRS